jgi:hypothetical protein
VNLCHFQINRSLTIFDLEASVLLSIAHSHGCAEQTASGCNDGNVAATPYLTTGVSAFTPALALTATFTSGC